MKNSNVKNAIGVLAVVGGILALKKIAEKRSFVKNLLNEYGIKEHSPFGFADKIRDLSDEQYDELKTKIKDKFSCKCCHVQKVAKV